jgi:hypothetical protein
MVPREEISWTDSVKNEDVVQTHEGKERPTYHTTKVTHSIKKNPRISYPNTLYLRFKSSRAPDYCSVTNYTAKCTARNWPDYELLATEYYMLLPAICRLQHCQSLPPSVMNNGNYLHTTAAKLRIPCHYKHCQGISRNDAKSGVEHKAVITQRIVGY